ncbi:MAG: hypothetical protein O7G30_05460 [Proteobacteria bacterium]|nr:hypothetical protein [Pseudomonadota bacterium]
MKAFRYSRWDGTQDEFSLDAGHALDALSDLMMEGLDAAEALEWMREHGFELAGLNMRVMGLEELLEELRAEAESLYQRYRMDRALDDVARRLDDILDREQAALHERHGYESARMNDFLEKRIDAGGLADTVERFREHEFEDESAGEDFQQLLAELDRLQRLEEFLEQRGERFRGAESADYEMAQEIRERIEALEQMARDLAEGNLQPISPEALRELLGDEAVRSFLLIRDLESRLREAGYLRGEHGPELTPQAIRRIGAQALADVYTALRRGRLGGHEAEGCGVATPRPDETRPWEFGDSANLDVIRTVINGVVRRAGEGAGVGAVPVSLCVDDFEVVEMDYTTQTTTVLLLDMSWSMSWAGRFAAAKRVALAMDQLIRTRFPRDHFFVVGFSTRARELPIRELPEVSWDIGDPFTNLQEGLMVAERLIRKHPSASPQILVVTDGQPTAYFDDRQLRVEWPNGFGGVSPHAVVETLSQVRRVTGQGITINTFMLDDAPELVGFVERMTQINRGRAFYTSPTRLGSFLMVDYISRRKLRRG